MLISLAGPTLCALLSAPAPLLPGAATPTASPAPVQDPLDIDELEALLRDLSDKTDFFRKRSGAVKKLAALGTPEAWELVLGALTDIAPKVCDQAQLSLAELRDPEVLEELYGSQGLKARDEWVRLRVAEALGRMQLEVDGEVLVKLAAGEREAEVRRTLLWSIERLARAERLAGDRGRRILPGLEKLAKRDSDPAVSAAALLALAAVDGAVAAALMRAASDDDREVVRATALVGAGFEPALCAAAADESLLVRTAVADALAERATPATARVLVERLELEREQRLRWRVLANLQRISGLKHRLDVRPWRDWAQQLGDDWTPASEAPAADLGNRSMAFAGLPLLSGRVCFLIDFSGSLWKKREDGSTPKEVVDVKLRAALEALPPETLFNVVPYTDLPIPWEEGLQDARPRAVEAALEFFEGCRESGKGNFFEAAELALADPLVDTIVVLTDGAPTGGHRWNLELMVPLLLEKNRFRQVAFDSILVDCPKNLAKHWRALAEGSGGRSISIELE